VRLELFWRLEPHWLHDLADQAEQRASVALAVLRRRHRVEQALPLRVARLARILADLQHRDEVGDLVAAHGFAQRAADHLDGRGGKPRKRVRAGHALIVAPAPAQRSGADLISPRRRRSAIDNRRATVLVATPPGSSSTGCSRWSSVRPVR
jgi:hypothetical protein